MPDERDMIVGDRVETRLTRLGEDVAEIKGEMRQMDKRLSGVEAAVTGVRGDVSDVRREISDVRKEVSDVRRDIRQVLFVVILGILIPILLELVRRVAG